MARIALYYPHWGVINPRFMFDALLYWDRLACIVPYQGFTPGAGWPLDLQRECDRLHDSYVTGLAPTPAVKERVHDRLEQLLDRDPPSWCRPENLAPSLQSALAMRKVSSRTIDMLTMRGWLARQGDDEALISRAAAGLLLGAFAEEMASDTMPPVTDERETFRAACNTLLRELEAKQGIGDTAGGAFRAIGPTEDHEAPQIVLVLAIITKLGIGDGAVSVRALKRLHDLCQDTGFAEQREKFRAKVDNYVVELRERPSVEHGPLRDHWDQELANDRRALKRELRTAGIEAIVEKEGLVATGIATAVGAGTFAAAGPLGLAVGIGLAGAHIADRVRRRRAEISGRHWTSWLDAVSSPTRYRFV